VTYVPPLGGAFRTTTDATGESNENNGALVPTTADSVTEANPGYPSLVLDPMHATDEAELQLEVLQMAAWIAVVVVNSLVPKFKPATVTDAAPE
jgi:hypothetical protein